MSKKSKQLWWLMETILDGPGCQEALAFRLRRGGAAEDIEAQYKERFSKKHAKALAKAGYTFIETTFFKGLGLEYERSEWERTARFLKWLRKLGVRTGVYTQWGSLFTETFFHEYPEAREWVQIGVDGRPIEYGDPPNQYFRWRGCPGHPRFLAFLKKAARIAVKKIGVDVVYFDNICIFEGHNTLCYCDCCRKGLRKYLTRKYSTPEKLYRRMGLRSVKHIEPPRFYPWSDHTLNALPIKDPLIQEFIEFRCEQLAQAWEDVYRYIRRLNPKATIMGNPSFPRKYNERLTSAIDFWRLKRVPALHYMENAVRSIGVRDGAVVSNIRGYKYGRVLGQRFVCCGGGQHPGLSFCEGLAFNDGSGGALDKGAEPFKRFYEKNTASFYRNVLPLTEVAVLRHDASLTWRWHESYTVMELAQQALMTAQLPWMPLWGQQLLDGTLEKYKVLVVPGCACLSKKEANRIMRFAKAGGGVVFLENAGTYGEYQRSIETWRFAPLFEGASPKAAFRMRYLEGGHRPEFDAQKKPLFARYGKGRVAYLPQIRKTRVPVRTYDEIGGYDGFQHLQLPAHWREMPRAVEKVAPETLRVRVKGPKMLMTESLQKANGRLMIHLLNYERESIPAGVEVTVSGTSGAAALYLPDQSAKKQTLRAVKSNRGGERYRLPAFARYALLVVE